MTDTMVCDNWPDKTALRTKGQITAADVKYTETFYCISLSILCLPKNSSHHETSSVISKLLVHLLSVVSTITQHDRYSKLSSSGPRPRSSTSRAVTRFCTNNGRNLGNVLLEKWSRRLLLMGWPCAISLPPLSFRPSKVKH